MRLYKHGFILIGVIVSIGLLFGWLTMHPHVACETVTAESFYQSTGTPQFLHQLGVAPGSYRNCVVEPVSLADWDGWQTAVLRLDGVTASQIESSVKWRLVSAPCHRGVDAVHSAFPTALPVERIYTWDGEPDGCHSSSDIRELVTSAYGKRPVAYYVYVGNNDTAGFGR